jgi:tetratricopeptide (TPR) repeat protein
MRRAALVLALLGACAACSETAQPARSPAPQTRVYTHPAWLPPYDAGQQALLAAVPRVAVDELAAPVYPDLERFTYEPSRPFVREQAKALAARIQQRLETSPRLYSLQLAEGSLANPIAQYGPPPPSEPDPWVRTVRTSDGYELAWARPGPGARQHVQAANRALAQNDPIAARDALQAAAQADPKVPGLWVALGRVHATARDDAAAEAAYLEALGIDERYFDAHLELALLYERRGAMADVRIAVSHALAIHPVSPRAREVARRLGQLQEGPRLPPVFIEVGRSGSIVVGTSGSAGARAYASCHAALRHEPSLRSELLGLPAEDPYHLSLAEERLCAEVLLVSVDPQDPTERELGKVLGDLAARGQLPAFVLFGGLGTHRPEWLRLAPDDLFSQVVDYVALHVLPLPS